MKLFFLMSCMFVYIGMPANGLALKCAGKMDIKHFDLIFFGEIQSLENLENGDPETNDTSNKAIFKILETVKGNTTDSQTVYYRFVEPWGPRIKPGEKLWIYANEQNGDYHFGLCSYRTQASH